jgi:osmoprotectant transport system substrate-binding protein
VDEVVAELRSRYSPQGLTVLDPSPAVDRNALAVTKETADRLDLRKTSDLAPVSRQLILGAPADCDKSPQCEQGLHDTYGISFRRIVALDPGKPTVDALERGDVQVAEIGSTDGYVRAKGMVILEDDKHLGDGDNVVLVVRRRLADDDTARSLWQDVLDQLSSSDLAEMNKRIQSDGEGVDTVAEEWLKAHGFLS